MSRLGKFLPGDYNLYKVLVLDGGGGGGREGYEVLNDKWYSVYLHTFNIMVGPNNPNNIFYV